MGNVDWTAVDALIAQTLLPDDPVFAGDASHAAGLPDIAVSRPQARFLELMVRLSGGGRVLEVGTLGGYSAIVMARALAPGGRLVTIEIDPHHAEVAAANFAAAGLADRIELLVGPAADVLPGIAPPFDLAFIDADKPSNSLYLREALRLVRPGGLIIVDNVVREGAILAPHDANAEGARAVIALAGELGLRATVLQTVGEKKWDGMLLAIRP
jgi:predicted O-methyltransferase YrrM